MNVLNRKSSGLYVWLVATIFVSSSTPAFLIAQTPNAARVTVVEVTEQRLVERLDLTGTVNAERSASLSPRASGLVSKMHVDAGHKVKAGQPLLELDAALAEASAAQARSAVTAAETQLAETKRLAQEGIRLAKTQAVPQSEVEARQSAVAIAESELGELKAVVQEREELLRRHILPAPFDGVISRKDTELGEWVETGDTVFALVDTDHLRLDVQAPQEWFHAIPDSAEAVINPGGTEDTQLKATVRAKIPVQNAVSRTFLILLDVEDPNHRLGPGMSASATFSVSSDRNALVVPRDAIVRLSDGSVKVWVVEGNPDAPIAQARNVALGRASGDFVEIREGVDPGEHVVIRGNEGLRSGQPLIVLPSTPETLTPPGPAT